MAKIKAPLFGLEASGTIGKTITYSKWKGIPYVRAWTKPKNPKTEKQKAIRTRFIYLLGKYHTLDWCFNFTHPILGYNAFAHYKRLAMSGLNYFLKIYMKIPSAEEVFLYGCACYGTNPENTSFQVDAISTVPSLPCQIFSFDFTTYAITFHGNFNIDSECHLHATIPTSMSLYGAAFITIEEIAFKGLSPGMRITPNE